MKELASGLNSEGVMITGMRKASLCQLDHLGSGFQDRVKSISSFFWGLLPMKDKKESRTGRGDPRP